MTSKKIKDARRKKGVWKNKLQAPISYLGGKRREIHFIQEYQPDNFKSVIDAFCGGASVGLFYAQEYKNCKVILNDINESQILLLTTLKQGGKELEEVLKEYDNLDKNDEDYYYKLHKGEIKDIHPVVKYLYLKACSKRGDERRGLYAKTKDKKTGEYKPDNRNQKSLKEFNKYKDIMKNVDITMSDYKVLLEGYKDDETAFIYLDCPYVSTKIDQYGSIFEADNLDYIKSFMLNCKCKVMLHIDFTGFTYDLFKDMIKHYYPVIYASSTSAKRVYQKYHCIITNYNNSNIV